MSRFALWGVLFAVMLVSWATWQEVAITQGTLSIFDAPEITSQVTSRAMSAFAFWIGFFGIIYIPVDTLLSEQKR